MNNNFDFTTLKAEEIENMTYEQARETLISIVNKLENGNLDLQSSMDLWKTGELLVTKCRNFLATYQTEVEEKLSKPTE